MDVPGRARANTSSGLGSAFLGDRANHIPLRNPFTSPPPPTSPTHSATASPSSARRASTTNIPSAEPMTVPPAPPIPPLLSLELRVRWLEALVLGVRAEGLKGKEKEKLLGAGGSLSRRTEQVQKSLNEVIDTNEGLRKFMTSYDQYAHLLTPAFALSPTTGAPGVAPPTYDQLSSEELETLIAELEPDLRTADRDMREVDALEKKGVAAAGKLPDHESLKPRLEALAKAEKENAERYVSLEKRVGSLLGRYSSQVTALSELFIVWNDLVTDSEDRIAALERRRAEQETVTF